MEKLSFIDLAMETGGLTYHPTLRRNVLSATLELALQNNLKTYKDKKNTCLVNTQPLNQSQILEVELTSKEKGYLPYWNEQYQDIASRLLLAIKTDLPVLGSKLSSGLLNVQGVKSWFSIKLIPLQSMNLLQTLWQSSRCSAQEFTDSEVIKVKSKQILLKPTKEQKHKLYSWAGSYRVAYNWTVEKMEQNYLNKGKSGSYLANRKDWIIELRLLMTWWKEIPAHIIYGAMRDAEKDYKSAVKKRIKGLVSKLPKVRKKTQTSFYMLGNAITEKGIYPRILGNLKTAEPLPNKPMDTRIIFKADKFWVRIDSSSLIL